MNRQISPQIEQLRRDKDGLQQQLSSSQATLQQLRERDLREAKSRLSVQSREVQWLQCKVQALEQELSSRNPSASGLYAQVEAASRRRVEAAETEIEQLETLLSEANAEQDELRLELAAACRLIRELTARLSLA
ncbi:hypothetical protein GPECTOR_43g894 [Gonium pectorale]|uniref:Uncharacterized protein n=1 Tax=Gonium pectorale TaxID=33097 RepID=A0A150G9E7_GONPE|nr:hypothetical protein GPECTOR_43g894 [Gonium pectorale]|eukprot:KXZ46458.1 hypothetical protein GPECTOR_43g894 [Gonium pectorale]